MTPLISARRAAEDFARVVDGTKVDAAGRYDDLTACVDALRAQETPAPRPEFVADLRMRLMAAADTLLIPAQKSGEPELAPVITLPGRRRERRLAVAAAAFVIVGGSAGVAAAAESALPGDPLYPIKRGIESAQVSLSSNDAAKGHELISQANTRLDEVSSLVRDGESTSKITQTLASFEDSATSGADLLFVSYQRDGDVDDLARLRATFGEQAAKLDALAAEAPSGARPEFTSAMALVSGLDQQARVLCGNCGPDSGPTDLSSASALENLLTQPTAAAAAEALKSKTEALADKAGDIAADTPKTPATGGTPTTGDGGSVPGVEAPTLTTGGGGLESTVETVTGGVEGLLDEVGTATGGATTPVTDPVEETVDLVTGLLGP